ncbi:sugar O-acyltransferase, sialic acid O-acetyltransferase NeuD family [Pricia antarctica]|uniref:Sugar O-acyltransferase, sialic acid O-acetyltransferase NeuD family n=2 Tax=Pricia antarctica TaxID=641691 RepID=A0A1G7D3Z4_9FLAO|nr:sugar O-acyltransferase, sialic acid O-acetyltransferase NeuD family [Pricia antarctica]
MKNVVIIGASGHGTMILDCLEKEGKYAVVGFVDSFKRKRSYHNGYQILGSENELPLLMDTFGIEGAIVAIGNNFTRKCMVDKVKNIAPSLCFISAIHPSAIIGKNVKIGAGSVIMPGAVVNANSKVGEFCIINTNSSLGHDGTMERFSSISSGARTGGNLKLGQFSAISLGANVIEYISIGEHSIIGAGSLVVKNVGARSVVYGCPARFIRNRSACDPYLKGDAILAEHSGIIVATEANYPN